jgi:multiple sugar transport system substrate-binding protein
MAGLTRRDTLKRLSAVALGALGASIGSACGATATPAAEQAAQVTAVPAAATQPAAATSGPVKIVYWHGWSGRFADYLDRVAVEFNKAYPDITVEFVQIDWGELYSKLLTAVAAGNPPDTYIAGNETGQLYSLAANGVIMALEDIGDPNDLASLKEAVYPAAWEIGTYEGKLWALPKWLQAYELYVNTDHLGEAGLSVDDAPKTMDDLDAITEKLYQRDADGSIRRLGFDPQNWYFHWWGRFHGQYVDKNGEPTATFANNVNCLTWMCSYSKKYDPTKVSAFNEAVTGSDAQAPFLTGMMSIYLSGPWHLGDIFEFKKDMPYTVWRLPLPAGISQSGMSTGGDIPVIPKGAAHPDASYKWCRFLVGVDNPEVYSTLWTVGWRPHMPISEKVARGDAFKEVLTMFPGYDVFVDDFYSGALFPPAKTPVAEFYSDRLNSNVEKARLLQATPEEALETTQKEASDELAKWKAAHAG